MMSMLGYVLVLLSQVTPQALADTLCHYKPFWSPQTVTKLCKWGCCFQYLENPCCGSTAPYDPIFMGASMGLMVVMLVIIAVVAGRHPAIRGTPLFTATPQIRHPTLSFTPPPAPPAPPQNPAEVKPAQSINIETTDDEMVC